MPLDDGWLIADSDFCAEPRWQFDFSAKSVTIC